MNAREGPISPDVDAGVKSHFTLAGKDFVCTVIDDHGGLLGESKVKVFYKLNAITSPQTDAEP